MVPHQIHTNICSYQIPWYTVCIGLRRCVYFFNVLCLYMFDPICEVGYYFYECPVVRDVVYIISWGQSETAPVLYSHQLPIRPHCMPLSLPLYQIRALLPFLINHYLEYERLRFFFFLPCPYILQTFLAIFNDVENISLYYKFHVDLLIQFLIVFC